MKSPRLSRRPKDLLRMGVFTSVVVLAVGIAPLRAQDTTRRDTTQAAARTAGPADSTKPLGPEQLQSLVAPIALYPDDLLAQTLAASTYPLEIVQLYQWMEKHPGVKDKALADSVAKQPWDPTIQSMAAVPEVVKRLAQDVQWTTDLGNAFLAQQADVMAAVQAMRKKAKDKGALETNEQQKVETKVVEETKVIVVESKNPEVVYVPSYSPTVVYGAPYPYYPYPPVYYPPYYAGAAMVSFGVGMMWGAAMWGGSCCHAGWGGGGNVYVNNNNNFNRNVNRNTNVNRGGNTNWSHNAQHRGGTPYGDRNTANRYGGNTRGDRSASAGAGNRGAGTGSANRGTAARSGGAGGSDRIGSRDIPRDGGGGSSARGSSSSRGSGSGSGSSGLSGGSRGYDGASARSSGSRGASSMGSRGGYSGSRGGGGFSRGGGGGGRRR